MKPFASFVLFMTCSWLVSCALSIPARDISVIRSGKSFNRLGEYLISPGDSLGITVLGEASLTGVFSVSQKGFLSLPIVGEFRAAGYSTTDLTKRLKTRLRAVLRGHETKPRR